MNNSTYPNNPQKAIFVPVQKCPYHITFDLDLEHTVDADLPGDHPVQVWSRPGHLPAYIMYIVTNRLQYFAPASGRSNKTDCSVTKEAQRLQITNSNYGSKFHELSQCFITIKATSRYIMRYCSTAHKQVIAANIHVQQSTCLSLLLTFSFTRTLKVLL